MSWDDDFPDERTDPAMVRPIAPVPSGGAQRPFPNEPSAAMYVQPGQGQFPSQATGANPIAGFRSPDPQRPISGGYPAAADDTFDGITPATGAFPASPTGVQPIIRNNTSLGMQAVGPPPVGEAVTTKMRLQFGALGVGAGVIIGLFLGLMNSALEDIPFGEGLPLTLQIAVWFGLMVGILTAWKPERFAHVWGRLTGGD